MEIEKMNFDHALGLFIRDGWAEPDIHDPVMQHALKPGFDEVNAIGRKLFAMRAKVCSGKPELSPQLRTFSHRSENGVVATEHCGGTSKIAALNSGANGSAAYHCSIYFHWRDSDDIELM